MQLTRLLIASCAFALTAAACMHVGPAAYQRTLRCVAGQPCSASGTLVLFNGVPAGAAMLTLGKAGDCVALALDSKTFDRSRVFEGRMVTVWGMAYTPPDMPEVMWYEFRGRRMTRGICDGPIAIYVDRLSRR